MRHVTLLCFYRQHVVVPDEVNVAACLVLVGWKVFVMDNRESDTTAAVSTGRDEDVLGES
jgi:CxxC motif-containing protein (DUF1111 family)